MTLLRLNRLPTPTDMTMLGCIGLIQFIEQFNANMTDPRTAKVELLHEGQTIALGDIAWEHTDNAWYQLDTMATSTSYSPLGQTDNYGHRELLTVTRDDHAQYTAFKIESTPSRETLSMQCFVATHHADRLAERIRELTCKGYFDTHPLAIDKLAQVCDVLLVGDRLVKCRMTLSRLMSTYYAPNTADVAELDEIINIMEGHKEHSA